MRNILVWCCIFFLGVNLNLVNGQQAAQYTMSSLNKYGFNPAYAGLTNSLELNAVYRQQWFGVAGAPESQNFNISIPLYVLKGGFGINIDNAKVGVERNTALLMTYNHWINVGEESIVSIGVSGGILQKTLDGSKIRTPNGNYANALATINHNDLLPTTKVNGMSPIFDVGLYFKHPVFELGVAVKNINEAKINLNDELISFDYSSKRNYLFNFGAELDLFDSFSILPGILLKSDLVETQLDASILLRYNDNIFLGPSFRGYDSPSIDAFSIIGGFKLNEKITLAYSYDYTLSYLEILSKGSHEVIVKYNLNKTIGGGIPPAIIYNPRFL